MAEQPTLWGKLLARVEGEVAADTLEAYRRAGLAVYDLLKQVEDRRLALKIQGTNPWQVDPSTQAEFLCTWNAFVLQTLGDQFLDADYQSNPATTGFVPPVTAQQVQLFYRQVEEWLSRAHQAQSNPSFHLDVHVPADLPPWVEVEPCPTSHLDGMLAATRSVRTHAEAALAVFQSDGTPPEKLTFLQQLQQMIADANTRAEYAQNLWGRGVSQELHEQIEQHAKDAVDRYYNLGQLLAMPGLLEAPKTPSAVTAHPGTPPRRSQPGPGDPSFDPWCLTDPVTRETWKRDRRARATIAALWEYDPAPQQTLAIQTEIDTAAAHGDVTYAANRSGQRLGHYYCCPWSAIYVVKRPVMIGGLRLRVLQQFTFDVSAEEMGQGGEFKRQILLGNFEPTTRVDYCDPHAPGHDED